MSASNLIELFGIIVSLILGLFSLLISLLTLKQNSKNIKESTRPYVIIYFESIRIGMNRGYFIIKNFGKTAALITDFRYDTKILKNDLLLGDLDKDFSQVKGSMLAPGQSIKIFFIAKQGAHIKKSIKFDICYSTKRDKYNESFILNIKEFLVARGSNSLDRYVSNALEEIVERQL